MGWDGLRRGSDAEGNRFVKRSGRHQCGRGSARVVVEGEASRVAMRGDGMQDVPPCRGRGKDLRRCQGWQGGGQAERTAACVCWRGGRVIGIVGREDDSGEAAIAVTEDDGFDIAGRDALHQRRQQGRREGHEQPREDGGVESRWAPAEVHERLVVGVDCLCM